VIDTSIQEWVHRIAIADDIDFTSQLFFQILLDADEQKEILFVEFDHDVDIALVGVQSTRRGTEQSEPLDSIFGLMALLIVIQKYQEFGSVHRQSLSNTLAVNQSLSTISPIICVFIIDKSRFLINNKVPPQVTALSDDHRLTIQGGLR
jgi:hypothetical protein